MMDEHKNQDDWLQLCALAANEQDPDKLFALVRRINGLLEEREKKLKSNVPMES
jgi:hypothetical protein